MWPLKRHLLGFSLICMTVPLCWLRCVESVSCYFAIGVTAWKVSKYDQKKLRMSQCLKHLIKCQRTTKLVESFSNLFCLGHKVFMCYVLPVYEKECSISLFQCSLPSFATLLLLILYELLSPYEAWLRSGIFTVNFEHISHLVLMILLLTLNM